jgi:hypothetical protein
MHGHEQLCLVLRRRDGYLLMFKKKVGNNSGAFSSQIFCILPFIVLVGIIIVDISVIFFNLCQRLN